MKLTVPLTLALAAASPLAAETTRAMDSHEHGVGTLLIAAEGLHVSMIFESPGADIVGFEHPAHSAADKAAISAALSVLEQPLEIFAFPNAAECKVSHAHATLVGDSGHDDHGHDGHADEGHDDHEHDDHANKVEEPHTEFQAEYLLTCANTAAITWMEFPYFKAHPNAVELEINVAGPGGARIFEATRDTSRLDLAGMF